MSETNPSRLLPGPGEVKLRLYGQGLGDCFLLAFPRVDDPDGQNPAYFVIDCGAAMSTPDKDVRMKQVVEDIREATGGHVDVLAITHQHQDHISGFQDAWQEWKKVRVGALYLPWTERAAERGEQKGTEAFRKALERAAQKALEHAAKSGELDEQPAFRAQADFLGMSLDADRGFNRRPSNMDEAMEFARSLAPGRIEYFEPGDVFNIPGTACHGYVLGPPLPGNVDPRGRRYIELLVDDADGVMYDYASLHMKVDTGKPGGANAFAMSDDRGMPALASGLLAAGVAGDVNYRGDDEPFCPFTPRVRLDWDYAMESPFFQEHYGKASSVGANGEWRRVDEDWLLGTADLALRAGDFMNNVSLVLAFDLPQSEKMLLFPGDAQVGNWLSWHTIRKWNFREGASPEQPPAANDSQTLMENLLSRVVFYKVGHHGSHNATIQALGLEKMTRDDLIAFIPVSVPVAQDLMGYCPMPFYPVVRALQRKTRGRVFLPSGRAVGIEDDAQNDALLAQCGIAPARKLLDAKRLAPEPPEKDSAKGKLLEGPVPLYLELTVAN